MSLADDISALLNDTNQTAAVALLVDLLRNTPGLRQWLHVAMLDTDTHHRFGKYLDGKLTPPAAQATGRHLLAWVANIKSLLHETARLRDTYPTVAPTHGGLTRSQVFALIRRHQAGPLALAPFLLIAIWRKAATDKTALPAALLATQKFFQSTLTPAPASHSALQPFSPSTLSSPALLRQLAHAAEFFQGHPPGKIGKPHYGHAKWWQLTLLTYMLANPRPAYRTREFYQHLVSQKIHVDSADIRRFCRKQKIARDNHPGRPRLD